MGFAVENGGIVKTLGSDPLGLITIKATPNTPVAKQFTQRLGALANKPWTTPLANLQEVQAANHAILPWVSPAQACAISGWLGGGGSDVPGKFLGTAHLSVDDIDVECLGESVDLNSALYRLRKRNPWAHRWVVAKGFAKAIKKNNNMQRNVDEDTAAFWNKVGTYLFSWKGGIIPLVIAGVVIWKFAGTGRSKKS